MKDIRIMIIEIRKTKKVILLAVSELNQKKKADANLPVKLLKLL